MAELAGISTDWYARLEQNRAETASEMVLERLAGALKLQPGERRYLFRLAGHEPPQEVRGHHAPHPSLALIHRHIVEIPAAILGPRLDVLSSNPRFEALMLGLGDDPRFGRNMVWFHCCEPRAEGLFPDGPGQAVGALRAAFARRIDDADFLELILELTQRAPRFKALWASQVVGEKTRGSKRVQHPEVGLLELEFHNVLSAEAPDQQLIVFEGRDKVNATRLAKLGRVAPHGAGHEGSS
ncbi:MAG: helix-turn-helix domain-containing protein [Myxococcales bacterium]|nr:helix-turn-helix domain-containing protein [Myxococcales bacterium]